MNEFSAIRAWSHGVRFLAARPGQNALLLIGLGLVVPIVVQLGSQYALTGAILERAAPGEAGPFFELTPMVAVAIQAGAFFAAWRLGFGESETLGRALRYGLIAGFVVGLVAFLLAVLAALAASQAGSPAIGLFVFLFTLAPLVLMLALFGTMAAALIGAGVAAVMVIGMITSAATGNMGLAATLVGGGSGFVVVLLLVLSVLMIWLAARFSCATAIMAHDKSYNPISAARASWELTWDEQWRIMLYLAMLGIILVVLLVGGLVAIGAGAATFRASTSVMAQGVGLVFMLGFALLMIFLAVMVLAGIYRQMIGENAPVEVFA